jgi:DNA-binding transcriptional regulator LsrR (DeoR family)
MLYDEILKELQTDYYNRVTQTEMGIKYNISQSLVGRLLSDNKNILGIKVETLQRMFPDTTIYGKLQTTNNQKVINSNNNIITQENNNGLEKKEFVSDLSRNILNHSDLTAEEKIKFLQILDTF